MINRASVQLWGKAGQSAGPPKSAGKKSGTQLDLGRFRSGGTDPILSTQRIPRCRDLILSTQRIGGGDLKENGNFLKENALRVNGF